jgi:phosphoribosylformimino-5-aminoimidazole carboxamide ribotide isomerase
VSAFDVIPAIDLQDGRCVRLAQGRFEDATVYGDDPGAMAASFASHAIPWLHVVDLDGARDGDARNTDAIRAIAERAGAVRVQVGGGIRSLAAIEEKLALGVDRVVLGTAALRDPELVSKAAGRFPGRIVVGLDAREGRVAVAGWREQSETSALDVARRFEDVGVVAIVYTDIARDGMLTGPNLESTLELADSIEVPVIVSGGIANEGDVLAAARHAERGIVGAIIGRALYTGAIDLARLLEALACS